MNTRSSAGFGGSRGFGSFNPGEDLWQALDRLRANVESRTRSRGAGRADRGDIRSVILVLLAEQPRHGYQIIQEVEERTGGAWKPSAGSIYPTLQQLTDEDLISVHESDGRKTYELTDAGRIEAEAAASKPLLWETPGAKEESHHGALPKAGIDLAQAAAQVARTGTKEQQEQAVEVLDDARRRLYAILAQG
ncbi:hypothetical protein GCM10010401_23460 [Rarobacter faecitabidus]|uniref:PadR family transcriptional regulator n=1 Tax=Rarobacter faecitabidus TaxID=13243 RepID=A0A542ZWE4_RARFA|nr:PadR family transcriptional regulator [Rarobacter faecitabidus]TQL64510.1 PadR family transcriptional regulator [Rarobacter faecitabidus]